MYLMDSIAQIAADPAAAPDEPLLWIFPDLHKRMKGAPRFLLDNAAINASVELTLGRPRILLDALAHVRVPYPVMWIEWEERGRERLRQEFGKDGITPDRPLPDRIGFLLEVDEGGRRGTATWAWSSMRVDVPHIAPITAYFDLDSRFIENRLDRMAAFSDGALINLWRDNPVQLKALYDIWETVHHRPSEWGKEFFAIMAQAGTDMRYFLNEQYCDVVGEYIDIWAIILLLTSSRQTVEYRDVDRSRINKGRVKKRETPLLDHTEVVMHLSGGKINGSQPRAPLAYARKSPRIHMVSRYLARRGTKHWIVEPYLRRSGGVVDRHVQVRG